jgi:uncharacterized SAM-binding protein YcdF (DUF218 family)
MKSSILKEAQVLWDYMKLNQPLQKADCLLVMGSHDLRVAEYGAKLYLDGWSPLMVCSGGLGNQTRNLWDETEARKFSRVAYQMGVPIEKILLEEESTNTSENITFGRRLLQSKPIDLTSILLVHKPYMERRVLATFQKLWPGIEGRVSSPPLTMREYSNDEISMEEMINIMVGDFQRILVYPQKGFQIEQPVGKKVLLAFESLVEYGFCRNLISDGSRDK